MATVDRGSPDDVCCVADVGSDTTLMMSLGHMGEWEKIDGFDPEPSEHTALLPFDMFASREGCTYMFE